MLVLNKNQQTIGRSVFSKIGSFFKKEDLIILNNTRVITARVEATIKSGKKIELLMEKWQDGHIQCLCNYAVRPNMTLFLPGGERVTVIEKNASLVTMASSFKSVQEYYLWLATHGSIPLPPYMHRSSQVFDQERYNTIFAKIDGSIAAPTASLHFDDKTVQTLINCGIDISYITLHCSFATFLPVRVKNISDHVMHKEYFSISEEVIDKIRACKEKGGRVIAVGTTVVRALESMKTEKDMIPGQYSTSIFITPGYKFSIVDCMLTNFHAPSSTPLLLTDAFAGRVLLSRAYEMAMEKKYRFLSYGDCMLLL